MLGVCTSRRSSFLECRMVEVATQPTPPRTNKQTHYRARQNQAPHTPTSKVRQEVKFRQAQVAANGAPMALMDVRRKHPVPGTLDMANRVAPTAQDDDGFG